MTYVGGSILPGSVLMEATVNPYTILVVERTDVVRRLTKRTIARSGCRVLEAASAAEALAVLARPEIQVDLVLIGAIGGANMHRSKGHRLSSEEAARPDAIPVCS